MFEETAIGIDVGHGYVKAINTKGERIIFPSVVSRRVPSVMAKDDGFQELLEGESQDLNIKNLKLIYSPEGQKEEYFVGVKALLSDVNTELVLSDDKFLDREELLKALVAVALLTDTKTPAVKIGIGLPVAKYDGYKDSLKEMFKGSHLITLLDMGSGNYLEKEITINDLVILQQSLATLYDYILNDDGSVERSRMLELKGKVGIIDLGTRTTDVVLVEDSILNENFSYTLDEGMAEVLKAVTYRIQSQLKLPVIKNSAQIEKIFSQRQGIYHYQGREYDLNPIFQEEVSFVADQILVSIKSEWKDHFNELSCTLLGGGGSKVFKEYFLNRFYNLRELEEPQFANACGYLKTLKAKNRKNRYEDVAQKI